MDNMTYRPPCRKHVLLRQLRNSRRYSQDELGWLASVPQSRLSRAERGYIQLKPEECHRLAMILNCPVNLVTRKEGEPAKD